MKLSPFDYYLRCLRVGNIRPGYVTHEVAYDNLKRLTGHDFGFDVEKWTAWRNQQAAPDGNNVYGVITAPIGLQPALVAVERLLTDGWASVYKSQFDGAETLRFESHSVGFESTALEGGVEHLLNGGVGGSEEQIAKFVLSLSEALSSAGVQNRFEIYDESGNLVQLVPQ